MLRHFVMFAILFFMFLFGLSGCLPQLEQGCSKDEDCYDTKNLQCMKGICVPRPDDGLSKDAHTTDGTAFKDYSISPEKDIGVLDGESDDRPPMDAHIETDYGLNHDQYVQSDSEVPRDAETFPDVRSPDSSILPPDQGVVDHDSEPPDASIPVDGNVQVDTTVNPDANPVLDSGGQITDANILMDASINLDATIRDAESNQDAFVCNPSVQRDETCDNVDDDCDGEMDDDFQSIYCESECGSGSTFCLSGTIFCITETSCGDANTNAGEDATDDAHTDADSLDANTESRDSDVTDATLDSGRDSGTTQDASTQSDGTSENLDSFIVDSGTSDVDECATNNGGCAGTCTNTEDGYECDCAEGRILGPDLRSCHPDIGIAWIPIQGGTFLMGSPEGVGMPDEHPQREVAVPSFSIAQTEITVTQYQACVLEGACTPPHWDDGTCYIWGGGLVWQLNILPESFRNSESPIVCIDWSQASAFASWYGARLPSEAEWEYAVRGQGENQTYAWGNNEPDCARAVFGGGYAVCPVTTTSLPCSKPLGNTAQGVCDMAGNVWEWVEDWYGLYSEAPTDGSARPDPNEYGYRTMRGGGFPTSTTNLRATRRYGSPPTNRGADVGFRIVLSEYCY